MFYTSLTDNNKTLHTKVFFKPTDTYSLLHKTSYNTIHKSQLIRFYRVCSFHSHFQEATQILFNVLRTRSYSRRFLRDVKAETLQPLCYNRQAQVTEPKDVIPLITTYNNTSKSLNFAIKHNFSRTQNIHPPLHTFTIVSGLCFGSLCVS